MVIRVYHGHYTYSLLPGSQERKNSRARCLISPFSTHPCQECGKELERTGSLYIFHTLLTTFHLQCRHRDRHSFLCPGGSALCSLCSSQNWCAQRAGSATRFLQQQDEDFAVGSGSARGQCFMLRVLLVHLRGVWGRGVLHQDCEYWPCRAGCCAAGTWRGSLFQCSTWDHPPASRHQGGSCQGIRRWCGCEKDVLDWSDSQSGCLCRGSAGGKKLNRELGCDACYANSMKPALSSRV